MVFHVFGFKHLLYQKESSNDIANQHSLMCIDDACMAHSGCMKLQEIIVLSKDHSSVPTSPCQMSLVRGTEHVGFNYAEYINATLS